MAKDKTPEEMNMQHVILMSRKETNPVILADTHGIPRDGFIKEIDEARSIIRTLRAEHADKVFSLTTLIVR